MKILVIGSSGQLGTQIFNLKNSLKTADFHFFNKHKLDISSPENVESFFKNNKFIYSGANSSSSPSSSSFIWIWQLNLEFFLTSKA